MNKMKIYCLKVLRRIYKKSFGSPTKILMEDYENNPNTVSEIIYNALMSEEAIMIARFGSTELGAISNYAAVKSKSISLLKFIQGKSSSWWWEDTLFLQLQTHSGFFPNDRKKMEQFCELMIEDMATVDILGSWLSEEHNFQQELQSACKVRFLFLDPFWAALPWTRALAGKKVLVVHPFTETIKKQYENRAVLFKDNMLPDFELKTLKAVQTIAGEQSTFDDWFEALNYMKSEINKVDFDICLIGCGAYGFPLAAHVKRLGKKGFHLGGSLQLLFGIRGKRWEKEDYSEFNYPSLINKYWVKPGEDEKPSAASKVEDGCYW